MKFQKIVFRNCICKLGNFSSPLWIVFQQIFMRGIVAAKFFIVASMIGPENMGIATAALVVIAVVDAVSDFGLGQAIIRRDVLTEVEIGSIWAVIIFRSASISLVLYLFAGKFADFMGVSDSKRVIEVISILPIIKSLLNPRYILLARSMNFRSLAFVDVIGSVADIVVSVISAKFGLGPFSLIIGTIINEGVRTALSWCLARKVSLAFSFSPIKDVIKYGFAIWQSNIAVSIANQLDKVIVGNALGGEALGNYQILCKSAQLVTTDVAGMSSGYIYPRISAVLPDKVMAKNIYRKISAASLGVMASFAVISLMVLSAYSMEILSRKFNINIKIEEFACALFVGVVGGGLLNLVSYVKAIGKVRAIAPAVFLQLLTLFVFAKLAVIGYFGVQGILIAVGSAGMVCYFAIIIIAKFVNEK
jgi:O-antigen/teichoic acid export membrane protein